MGCGEWSYMARPLWKNRWEESVAVPVLDVSVDPQWTSDCC